MARNRNPDEETSQDSFLDVVANVVGVLIILVMLVGMQASQSLVSHEQESPSEATGIEEPSQPTSTVTLAEYELLQEEFNDARQELLESRDQVVSLSQKVTKVSHQIAGQERQRMELAVHRSLIEKDIEQRRAKLDDTGQEEFDVQRDLLESQLQLEQLNQERVNLLSMPDQVEEIESIPTPRAKIVDEPSIHLRLRHGLISIVPIEQLQEELNRQLPSVRRRLQNSSRVVEIVGPIDGYRLKYEWVKRVNSPVGGITVGNRGVNSLEQLGTYLPTSEDIGENLEVALQPGSTLYRHLQARKRSAPPVDIWLYPDSYDKYSLLKRTLWEMGFAISTRALEEGQQIQESPRGRKSAAQ